MDFQFPDGTGILIIGLMCFPRVWTLLVFLLAIPSGRAMAAELVEVLPLTRDIILLHVDDGSVRKHVAGEPRSMEWVVEPYNPMETTVADTAASFSISSLEDPNYQTSTPPTRIWRKTKGTEWTWLCQQWTVSGCNNTDPDHTNEHWLYLKLPEPMISGRTYSVAWPADLKLNVTGVDLVSVENRTRSEAIHVNQIGYRSDSTAKYGYLHHWMGSGGGLDLSAFEGQPFRLVRTDTDETAFTGMIAFRKPADNVETGQINNTPNQNFLGAAIWECDFTAFSQPGEYVLVVDGIGSSFPFRIDRDPYREPFHVTMKGLYQNRSGIALVAPYTDHPRPAPHHPGMTPGFAGRLKYSSHRFIDMVNQDSGAEPDKSAIEAAYRGNLTKTWGWYQDAGDWDGYFSHFEVPSGLLFLWEARSASFSDGELNIPESGNGIPDLLDEAAWLPRFYHRLRHELIDQGWGTGGVGSRVFGDAWGKDEAPDGTGRGSWQDTTRDWYVTGEDPFSTYRYAAVAAQLASALRTLGAVDPEGVDWETEARESYAWALANTKPSDESIIQQDAPLGIHRAYAAAALYRLTRESGYGDQAALDLGSIGSSTPIQATRLWATVLYLGLPADLPVNATVTSNLRHALTSSARSHSSDTAEIRGARFGGDFHMPMLIGQSSTPLILPAILGKAAIESSSPDLAIGIQRAAFTTADYFLGNNPLNMTWISGCGDRHPVGFFHMDAWYSGAPKTYAGIVPYGPWFNGGQAPEGPWSHTWAYQSLFPDISQWPGHELWFDSTTAPLGGEFTIHQNTMPAAVTYGFLTVPPDPPVITTQPEGRSAEAGDSLELTVTATGPGPFTYQWNFNGNPLPGANQATVELPSVQTYQSGDYTVEVSGPGGTVSSGPATVDVTLPATFEATLLNISTRGFCLTGSMVLIPGFVTKGAGSARLLARVIGPSLSLFDVPDRLPDPNLKLKLGAQNLVENEDWGDRPDATLIASTGNRVGAFALPQDSLDAAALEDLPAEAYTIVARDLSGATGNALVEVYLDPENSADATLSNISTRGSVQIGAGILIGGLTIGGEGKGRFLIRGVGPGLEGVVPEFLLDPRLRVFSGSELIALNDNWSDGPGADTLPALFDTLGAFSLEEDSNDAALLLTLSPGAYTVTINGVGGTTGTALVEIYLLD